MRSIRIVMLGGLMGLSCGSSSSGVGDEATPPAVVSAGGAAGNAGSSGNSQSSGGAPCAAIAAGMLRSDAPGVLIGTAPSSNDTILRRLRIELNEPGTSTQAPGSFDLAMEPDYANAAHVVLLLDGANDVEGAKHVYLARAGTMKLDAVTSPPTVESKGSLADVVLREVAIDGTTGETTDVAGGACFTLKAAAWDTTVPVGSPCKTADECGDVTTKVCDPAKGTCALASCGGAGASCPSGSLCFVEVPDGTAGVCVSSCTPGGTCAGAATCVPLDGSAVGRCVADGTGDEGATCPESAVVTTGCKSGLVCVSEGTATLCRVPCDPFGAPACATGRTCVAYGYCAETNVDDAALGAACPDTAPEGMPCAASSGVAKGLCATTGAGALVCSPICRAGAQDCAAPATCHDEGDGAGACF